MDQENSSQQISDMSPVSPIVSSDLGSISSRQVDHGPNGILDRHRWLPALLLILLPFLVHLPLWLSGRSTDPIWFTSILTKSTAGFPGYPWIDANVGVTSEALGRLSAWDWVHGIVPWWNPYNGIGMPLAGELQPGSFFLPFVLLFLLPNGVLWQQICMQIIAGLATYILLRELGLSRLAAVMGGALFALNGTIAWSPGPASVYCSLPFLPLLIWGIEQARKAHRGAVSMLAIGIAIAYSILPGFPESAYISGLLAAAWGFCRLIGEPDRWRMLRRTLGGFLFGLLVTLPLLIAFADDSLQSNSFAAHTLGERSMPWAAFTNIFLPYAFGSIENSVQSVPLTRIWNYTGGYAGILLVLLAVIGLTGKRGPRPLKILLGMWVLLCWAKTYGLQPVMGLLNYVPLLRQTQFYRYSHPSWIFALIVLAAFALDEFSLAHIAGVGEHKSPRRRTAFSVAAVFLAAAIALGWPMRTFWQRPPARLPAMFLLLAISIAWAVAALGAVALAWTYLRGERRRIAIASVLVFDAAVMFMMPFVSSVRGIETDTAGIQFLQQHLELSRSFSFAPLAPNYSAYVQVASINHNILPVPRLWETYIDENLLQNYSKIDMGATFFPAVAEPGAGERALNTNLANYLNIGVRYVLTNPGDSLLQKTYLPDRNAIPIISAQKSIQARLGGLSRLLHRGHSTTQQTKSADSSLPFEDDKVRLRSGQSVTTHAAAMPRGPTGLPVSSIGVTLLNERPENVEPFGESQLSVTLCADGTCRSGHRLLEEWKGSNIFQVPLDQPLEFPANSPLQLTLTYTADPRLTASSSVALWLGPPTFGGQSVHGPSEVFPGHDLHLVFEYGSPVIGARKVFTDSTMDIWELANPAPYFEITQGGPCVLDHSEREQVTIDCAAAARIRRRELFMPGWQVFMQQQGIGDGTHRNVEQDGIFQSVAVPAGTSHLRYSFSPPHMTVGWAGCFAGFFGLFWQIVMILRPMQRGEDADFRTSEPGHSCAPPQDCSGTK